MVSFRYGKAKNGHFWTFSANYGPISHRNEGFEPETCTKYVGILGEAFYVVLDPIFISFRYGKGKNGRK